jgi:protease-4
MNIIKAGEVKDSGSMFHEMTPHEQELWQGMVDHAYLEFLQVVERGRPNLKGKLQEDVVIDEVIKVRYKISEKEQGREKKVHYTRYRADGGIWVADEAKKYGLIDQIGYLEDAIKAAKQAAGLSEDYRAVDYERPLTLLGALLGEKAEPPSMQLDVSKLADAATPRLWYLAPQSELAGILAAAGRR